MIRPLLLAASVLLLPVSGTLAQQNTSAPTMNPEKESGGGKKKAAGNGLGFAQKDRPKGAKTEITCQDEATFDNNSSIATFVGKVVVKDPQFSLFCDKLTVFLNKERKGIEHAEAAGNVVIVQENTDDKGNPNKSIGRGGKAIVYPDRGDIELHENPSIQQGINNHISTDPKTIMILNRDGKLDTRGGSRTVIIDATEAVGQ